MAYNEARTETVRALLGETPHVTEKKMFGSVGFMVNGKLCIGVGDHADHVMMVRIGKDAYADALKQRGAHPAIMRGHEMKGYVFLDEAAVQTDDQIKYWVELALKYNSQLL
jgi:TfoX/Sxy family transcriptional regulator of competence genes